MGFFAKKRKNVCKKGLVSFVFEETTQCCKIADLSSYLDHQLKDTPSDGPEDVNLGIRYVLGSI